MRWLYAAVISATMLASATPCLAVGECDDLIVELLPGADEHAVLPLDPRLIAVAGPGPGEASLGRMTATLDGVSIPTRLKPLGRSAAWAVYEVDVAARSEGLLVIAIPGAPEPVRAYRVARGARRSFAALVASEPVRETCVASRFLELTTIGDAIALRVEWAASVDELARGRVHTTWLPVRRDRPVDALRGFSPLATAALGKVGCRGLSIPRRAFEVPTPARVIARFVDGGEALLFTGLLQLDVFGLWPLDGVRTLAISAG